MSAVVAWPNREPEIRSTSVFTRKREDERSASDYQLIFAGVTKTNREKKVSVCVYLFVSPVSKTYQKRREFRWFTHVSELETTKKEQNKQTHPLFPLSPRSFENGNSKRKKNF